MVKLGHRLENIFTRKHHASVHSCISVFSHRKAGCVYSSIPTNEQMWDLCGHISQQNEWYMENKKAHLGQDHCVI